MDYSVRTAVPADLPGIEASYLRSWRAAYEDLLNADALKEQAEIRRDYNWVRGISSPDDDVAVAVDDDGRVIGVVQAREDPGGGRDLPEITMLYVDPVAWGTGAATDLLEAAVEWIRARGHDCARLRVVEEQARARRFYEREGWTADRDLHPHTTVSSGSSTTGGVSSPDGPRLTARLRRPGVRSPVARRRRDADQEVASDRGSPAATPNPWLRAAEDRHVATAPAATGTTAESRA